MTSVVVQYIKILQEHEKLYGSDTVVLMQVGSFYEMYGIDNEIEKIGKVEDVSRLLNMVMTKRDKKLPGNSRKNPLMLGFPCVALAKYVPVLIAEDYTVVLIDQVKTGLTIKREVTDVISKATYMEGDESIVLMYLEKIKSIKSGINVENISVGISVINVMTGKTSVHECFSDKNAIDDAGSFAQQYKPAEVVVCGADNIVDLGLSNDVKYTYRMANKITHSIHYQEMVFGIVWPNKTMMSCIEAIDLECRPLARIALLLLIEYVHEHRPLLISRVSKPTIYVPTDHLILAANTVEQLNITSSRPRRQRKKTDPECLLDVIDHCSTSIGRRLLKERLLSPIHNQKELERRYDEIEKYGIFLEEICKELGKHLTKISDIEKLHRRMSLGIMSPYELCSLYNSYNIIEDIQSILKAAILDKKLNVEFSFVKVSNILLRNFLEICERIFDIEGLSSHSLDLCSFKKGVYEDIDEIHNEIAKHKKHIDSIAKYLSSHIGDSPRTSSRAVKVEKNAADEYTLSLTNVRANILKKALGNSNDFSFKYSKAGTKVTSDAFEAASTAIAELSEKLKQKNKEHYTEVIGLMHIEYEELFNKVVVNVAALDVTRSNYITSQKYNYCRPVFEKNNSNHAREACSMLSSLDAKDLRHPIIERIDNGTEYVPNDISIGKDFNGIVLYSMNSGGKTSLLKACGLAVVLAQMGSFVPASSFELSPFSTLITRILSEDNILRGRSSFVSEMRELRSIFSKTSDTSNGIGTLVLADEITHGTEHTSGSAIFASSVITLASRQTNFVFTTHLHNVHSFISNISNVRVCHLTVSVRDGIIYFDRKLSDGPGSSIYGLEICEFMDMDPEFIAQAFLIRNQIEHDKRSINLSPLSIKKSKYNQRVMIQSCTMCNYSPRQNTDIPLDVHHINSKCLADDNHMIQGQHKNSKSNLIVLCKHCHNKVHNGELDIKGYVNTSAGIISVKY